MRCCPDATHSIDSGHDGPRGLADHVGSHLLWSGLGADFGLFASTAFTLLVVPVMYYVIYGRSLEAAQPESDIGHD